MLEILKRAIPGKVYSSEYRPDIDGLRGLAVILVIGYHLLPQYINNGFIGVDIFFVISGFVITRIIDSDIGTSQFSMRKFYAKRVGRIYPSLITVLIAIIIVGWYSLFGPEFLSLGLNVLSSSFFSENFYLWHVTSYFDSDANLKPTLHLWSLAVEEQFYIIWPILLVFLNKYKVKVKIVMTILLLSFAFSVFCSFNNHSEAYYSPLSRFWEILSGAITYFTSKNKNGYAKPLSFLGLSLIVLGLFMIDKSLFPGLYAAIPVVGTCLIIRSGKDSLINRKLLSFKPLIFIGLISYPLYLWHWPIISFINIYIGINHGLKRALACALLSLFLSILTFLFIEKKFHRSIISLMFVMAVISVTSALISFGLIESRIHNLNFPERNEWSFLKEKTDDFHGINNLTSEYAFFQHRHRNVMYVGDSHVAQYSEFLYEESKNNPKKPGITFSIGALCAPLENMVVSKDRTPCAGLIKKSFSENNFKKYNKVIIGGAWSYYFSQDGNFIKVGTKKVALNTKKGMDYALRDLLKTISNIKSKGIDVEIVLDGPFSPGLFKGAIISRIDPFNKKYLKNITIPVDEKNVYINEEMKRWATINKIKYIDTYSKLCDGNKCLSIDKNGTYVYKDSGHLNPDWVSSNAKYIGEIFN